MIIASWKVEGLFKANAEKVAEEIMQMQSNTGVTPEQIVDAAKEGTELHKCFEWRDDIAAKKYRIQQARQIMCNLVFECRNEPTKQEPVRLMYKTTENDGYKSINLIMQKPDEYKALLNRAYSELQAFKNKYRMLKELKEIFDLIP